MRTAAEEKRDEDIARVDASTDEAWREEARDALLDTIEKHGEFTTDDIDCKPPREPRAWGPILLWAARAGVIENTGRVRKSVETQCNARPKAIWKRLV